MQTPSNGGGAVPTDAELVDAARAGTGAAFGQLVRRYQSIAVARAYAHVADRAEAEDIAQEAFMRAHRYLDQLRKPASFGPWLLQTVSNVARRASDRRSRRPGPLPETHPAPPPPPRADVLDAIAALPEAEQQVIQLHYCQGYKCSEIARLLGLQLGSITSRLTRARQKLRRLLSEDDQ